MTASALFTFLCQIEAAILKLAWKWGCLFILIIFKMVVWALRFLAYHMAEILFPLPWLSTLYAPSVFFPKFIQAMSPCQKCWNLETTFQNIYWDLYVEYPLPPVSMLPIINLEGFSAYVGLDSMSQHWKWGKGKESHN